VATLLARLLLVRAGQTPCWGGFSSGHTQAIFRRWDMPDAAAPGQNGRKLRSVPTGRPRASACTPRGYTPNRLMPIALADRESCQCAVAPLARLPVTSTAVPTGVSAASVPSA